MVTRTTAALEFLPVRDFSKVSVAHSEIKEIEIRLHTVLK